MDKDLYEILGVSKKATETEIRKAFHKLAKKYHPDVNQGNKDYDLKFKEINLAYEVLKDEKKRAQYDQMRAMGANPFARGGQGAGGQGAGHAWGAAGAGPFGPESFQDLGLGDLFEEIFGGGFNTGGPRGRGGPRKGSDQETVLRISFLDAAKGAERTLDLNDGRRLSIKIPEGVESGSRIKLSGQGAPGFQNGPKGDLYVILEVASHPYFERQGNDLILKLPITFSEAVLGAEVEVPTLTGKVFMKIPVGTSSGQKLKLSKKGVRSTKTNQVGDLYVELQIKIPKTPDSDYVEAAKTLGPSRFNPRSDMLI